MHLTHWKIFTKTIAMNCPEFMAALGETKLRLLREAVESGFYEYITDYSRVSFKHHPRTRASIIHDHICDHAKCHLAGLGDVQYLPIGERNLFEVDGKMLINFKKLDEQLRSSNYPTQTAMNFVDQTELNGIPASLPRITVGYVPKSDFTSISGVYAVKYGLEAEVEWELDIISTLDHGEETGNEEGYGT